MRVLFVAPYVPSPIRVRPFEIVRALSRLGHTVSVLALDDGTSGDAARAGLESLCERVEIVPHASWRGALQAALALPTPVPLWSAYCRSTEMARRLRTLLASGRFDIVHVEHLRAAHLASELGGHPAVFDAVDCITALQRQLFEQADSLKGRLLAWEEWAKLKGFEPRLYRHFAQLAVTSTFDAEALRALSGDLPPIRVIPNGVDLERFAPLAGPEGRPQRDALVFSGKMSYRANEDAACYFVEQVLPRIRQRRPGATLTIVGSNPGTRVRALEGEGISVTGYVADLAPYLARASVAVCPMRIGVGIQNKALEAMAMGRPVVASPIAARALCEDGAGEAVRVAGDPEELAEACVGWLADPESAERAGEAARRYVERHHRWERAAQEFVALYRLAAEKKRQ